MSVDDVARRKASQAGREVRLLEKDIRVLIKRIQRLEAAYAVSEDN